MARPICWLGLEYRCGETQKLTVILRSSNDVENLPDGAPWLDINGDDESDFDTSPRSLKLGGQLEEAFDAEASTWWELSRILSGDPSANLAHMPASVANASDFGLMLAWSNLVRRWAKEPTATIVICDDPWLFRHLRTFDGVDAGRTPRLLPMAVRLAIRGFAARTAAAVRFAISAIGLRRLRSNIQPNAAALLVYGHPHSTPEGYDGYFGTLLKDIPGLTRCLHADCPAARAAELCANDRTVSLHLFGNPLYTAMLPFKRWRPVRSKIPSVNRWLILRAVAHEGSTGQAAAIAWQIHCQTRWLRHCRPSVVAWPWENHSWERSFVRMARRLGIRTVGYQHSVIGRQMLNYAAFSNPDGEGSLPDRILCTGQATRNQLTRWGISSDRLSIGGAHRFQKKQAPILDSSAPIFLALPFDPKVAREMVDAARRAADTGHQFIVKDHPMTPFKFVPSEGVEPTNIPLERQQPISRVVYAATTVGLEAVLAGLPTARFRPRKRIALDILPVGVTVPVVDSETIAKKPDTPTSPRKLDTLEVFGTVDISFWREALNPHS